jgi:hypothetical protein
VAPTKPLTVLLAPVLLTTQEPVEFVMASMKMSPAYVPDGSVESTTLFEAN